MKPLRIGPIKMCGRVVHGININSVIWRTESMNFSIKIRAKCSEKEIMAEREKKNGSMEMAGKKGSTNKGNDIQRKLTNAMENAKNGNACKSQLPAMQKLECNKNY